MDISVEEFDNGIRFAHKQITCTKLVHCGFIIDIGSRDEQPHQHGLAHFWEHMLFKGTSKRKAFHILNSLESVGGELNAYTTKEKLCIYASVLSKYFNKALDILTDITFNSVFPEKQIETEKRVILEEMAMYLDSPEDCLQEDFEQLLFDEHPLGKQIMGTPESISQFTRNDFRQFIAQNLDTSRIVFSCVGNIEFKVAEKKVRSQLSQISRSKRSTKRHFTGLATQFNRTVPKELHQSYCAIGGRGYSINDPKRHAFFLLINLLGGPALNSKLNLALRERHGLAYHVEANFTPYSDIGQFAIQFATEHKSLERAVQLTMKEISIFKNKLLTEVQLHKAKEQLIGQLIMAEENNVGLMLAIGKSLLDQGYFECFDDVLSKVNEISANDIIERAREIFEDSNLSYLFYRFAS